MTVVQIIILTAFALSYLAFSIWQTKLFLKNFIYIGGLKIFHVIMIWLIPFVWALLLKGLNKKTPGSYEVENKSDPEPFTGGRSYVRNF